MCRGITAKVSNDVNKDVGKQELGESVCFLFWNCLSILYPLPLPLIEINVTILFFFLPSKTMLICKK